MKRNASSQRSVVAIHAVLSPVTISMIFSQSLVWCTLCSGGYFFLFWAQRSLCCELISVAWLKCASWTVGRAMTWTNVAPVDDTMVTVTKHKDAWLHLCGRIHASHPDAAALSDVLPKLEQQQKQHDQLLHKLVMWRNAASNEQRAQLFNHVDRPVSCDRHSWAGHECITLRPYIHKKAG